MINGGGGDFFDCLEVISDNLKVRGSENVRIS